MSSAHTSIELRSDNSAGVAPEILEAMVEANVGSAMAYGGDQLTARLTALVRDVFEHPEATVYPVGSGTAANALALSAMTPPWGAVLCHETAHIMQNEAGATSMFSAGAIMRGLGGEDFMVDADLLSEDLELFGWNDPHHSQPSVLSLTIPSDYGTVTPPKEVARLTDVARRWGLKTHVDGARFANAVAALGCAPADLTWRSGVDMLSFGAIKNGGASCDAIVCFDPELSEPLMYRLKRAGHVASKMRFQSAQLIRYLTDGLWLDLAGRSNAAMKVIAEGLGELGFDVINRPDVNIVFVRAAEDRIAAMEEAGLVFYRIAPGVFRFVTSFQTSIDDAHEVVRRLRTL
jgi:threonine aldolase